MTRHIWSTGFVVTVAVAIGAVAGDGAADVVRQRRELMQAMARDMDEIARQIVEKRDLAAIGENAMKVRQAADKSLQLFPPGSETGATEAKPTIWERWDQFQAKMQNLVQAARALENIAASRDPGAIVPGYVAVRRACGECHVLFQK